MIDRLKVRRDELVRRENENNLLERQAKAEESLLLAAAESMKISSDGLEFLEEVANSRRGHMKGRIEKVLTEALQLVYDSSRRVELSYTIKNNRSYLEFDVVRSTADGEVRRALDGAGAGLGVSDTIAVPLRLLVLLGSKQADRVCILDESYRHLNPERVPLAAQFLRALTEELGMQVIMASHHDGLRDIVDSEFYVSEGETSSVVERVG